MAAPCAQLELPPYFVDTPQTRRCVLVDDTLDERIVAEMDAVFAMDRMDWNVFFPQCCLRRS